MEREQAKLETPINIRAKAEQKNIIEQACRVLGKNRSEFMLEASVSYAQDVLLEQNFFQLGQVDFDRFCEILETPPKPTKKLKALLQQRNAWDV